ncbi:MAG: methylated-DNA--[protein]-cysteine S-methyltransferase [Pseudomonadota bacterium]
MGPLTLTTDANHLVALDWLGGHSAPVQGLEAAVADQLAAYFDGTLTGFDVPLGGFASPFAEKFAHAMINIPLGETATYGELAKTTGVSAQAAGQACGANRIPIIIPCHRVMGAKGLTGYSGAGGVETKVWLLRHEGAGAFLL